MEAARKQGGAMNAHTPTPWGVELTKKTWANVRDNDGSGNIILFDAPENDAALIVRAVNAYESNQATIAALANALREIADPFQSPLASPEAALANARDTARAALKLAWEG